MIQTVPRRGFIAGALGGAALLTSPQILRAQGMGGRKVVRAIMHAPLGVLDPVVTNAYMTRNHGYMVYDTLFALDERSQPQPQMVGETTISDDGLIYEFRLRPGMKFHDGSPVTAADCVASITRWAKLDLMGGRMVAAASAFEAASADTIRLVLKQPYGLVLQTLAKPGGSVPFIMPARIAETPLNQRITEVVGSGPFRFAQAEFRPGDRIVYERFEGYVPRPEPASGLAGGKAVKLDRVEWMEITDQQTVMNALTSGEVQVVENIGADYMAGMRRRRDITLLTRITNNSLSMRMNWLQAPFNDLKVRQAVLHAVNQADYLAAQIGDDALSEISPSFYGNGSPYRTEAGAVRKPDLNRARALLKESGYAGETVSILHPADLASASALAPVTEAMLKSIGMNPRVDVVDWNTLLARRNKHDPVSEGGWSIVQGVWTDLDLFSPLINPNLDGRGRAGYIGWSESAEIERMKNDFAAATDTARQREIAADIQKLAYERVFAIPLGSYKVVSGHNAGVRNVIAKQLLVFWNMELAS
ncbi:ABC transporter substrate-binding protein [Roseomonas populi]|uniref:ABC transporter substrate-binding protein n=1 Tax=Roseomonas populi TaxID=3121582 RepID=A0ABT1XBV3_9PROT|nr:ABC transporter substrate-binding protein [Roseomonas pecuniae]MCR0985612.1 ABC transporter substrate-binding protein [Roseomonas pecuniae]